MRKLTLIMLAGMFLFQILVFPVAILPSGSVEQFAGSESGLVAYWKFDEGNGTMVYDGSGNDNHGTLPGFLVYVADYGASPWGTTPSFPDNTAKWIWKYPDAEIAAPVEEFWVVREFNLASSDIVTISITVDNYYTLYVDETLVGSAGEWESTETYNVPLSTGLHYLKMKVGNAGIADNPAGLIASVKDSANNILFNTQDDGTWRHGASWVDGKYGTALHFDGVDDYVEVSDSASLDVNGQITMSFWIKPGQMPNYVEILHKNLAYLVRYESDKIHGFIHNGTSWEPRVISNTTLSRGTWYHIGVTYDGLNLRVYIDGELDGIQARTGPINPTTAFLSIGSWSGVASYFNGTIDEVKIYNRALSGDEVGVEFRRGLALLETINWPMFRHDTRHIGYSDALAPKVNETLWAFTTGGPVRSSPAVVDGKVYVGSDDGKVYRLDQFTGDLEWFYQTGDRVRSSPAVFDGNVYVGSDDGNVYALNVTNGALIWKYATNGSVRSSPVMVNGKVVFGSDDGRVYALNADTGALVWNHTTGAAVGSSPSAAYGKVFVGSNSSMIYALDQANGTLIWNYTTGGPVFSSPTIRYGRVFVGSGDGSVYALNATTGKLMWNYTTGGPVYSSPAVDRGLVFIGSSDGGVYVFNATGGVFQYNSTVSGPSWINITGSVISSPAIADGMVFVGSNNKVFALDEANGTLIWWNYTTGGSVYTSPAIANGMVFVGSYDSKIYAIGFRERPYLVGFWGKPNPTLIERYGGKIEYIFDIVPVIVANLTIEAYNSLSKEPEVEYIEDDSIIRAAGQVVPWNIDRIGATKVHSNELPQLRSKGAGVKVAVLDTGVDYNHPDLSENFNPQLLGKDLINNDDYPMDDHEEWLIINIPPLIPFTPSWIKIRISHSHGTHVAGIIAARNNTIGVVGVAPEAELYAVKVLDADGEGDKSIIGGGIQWAVKNGMDIISMSLGFPSHSVFFQRICDQAYKAGKLLVAAAGNEEGGYVKYPAAYVSVIAVSATNYFDSLAGFSNVGPQVELSAPGVYAEAPVGAIGIWSTVRTDIAPDSYGRMWGTSMAAPHVSGTAALVWSVAPWLTNDQVRLLLRNTATDLPPQGKDDKYGYGLVNASEAVAKAFVLPRPIIGQQRALLILVTFTDQPSDPAHNETYFREFFMNQLNQYWQTVSYNKMWYETPDVTSWLPLPHNKSYYGSTGNYAEFVNDSITAATSDGWIIGYYDQIFIVFAGSSDGFRHGAYYWRVQWPTEDVPIGIAWVSEYDPLGVWALNTGRMLGHPDLYNHDSSQWVPLDGQRDDNFNGPWNLMAFGYWLPYWNGTSPSHPSVWSLERFGWLNSSNIEIISPGRNDTFYVWNRETNIGSIKAIKVMLSPTRYYLVEVIKSTAYDEYQPEEGVLITLVNDNRFDTYDPASQTEEPPVKVIDENDTTPSLHDALWPVGKNFTYDNVINITILSVSHPTSTSSYYTIYVENYYEFPPDLYISHTYPMSTDIWIDSPSNGYGVYEVENERDPGNRDTLSTFNINNVTFTEARIYARIRNNGGPFEINETRLITVHFWYSRRAIVTRLFGISKRKKTVWEYIGNVTIPPDIKPGKSMTVNITWVAPLLREHPCIKVIIDPHPAEADLSNNEAVENVFNYPITSSSPFENFVREFEVVNPSTTKNIIAQVLVREETGKLTSEWFEKYPWLMFPNGTIIQKGWVVLQPNSTETLLLNITIPETTQLGDNFLVSVTAYANYTPPTPAAMLVVPIGSVAFSITAKNPSAIFTTVSKTEYCVCDTLIINGTITPSIDPTVGIYRARLEDNYTIIDSVTTQADGTFNYTRKLTLEDRGTWIGTVTWAGTNDYPYLAGAISSGFGFKVGVNDIAIVSVIPSSSSVVQGGTMNIEVNITNQGDFLATTDVTTYFDSNPIETKTGITLTPGETRTLTYYWDTSGVTYGTYTIKANATVVPCEINKTNNAYIDGTVRVLSPPVATKTYSPFPNPVAGETATFNASASYDPDGTIISYAWSFGDSYTDTGMIVEHIYETYGLYTVNLTVTDNDGLTDTHLETITVHSRPVASFTYSPLDPSYKETVTFDASGSYDLDGTIVSYVWNFGDGYSGTGKIANHTYSTAGSYTVNLTITDNDGLTATHLLTINVHAELEITVTSGGTTDPSPGTHKYLAGTVVSVTAIPYANYRFDHWELNGVNYTVNPISVTMDTNHALHAVFVPSPGVGGVVIPIDKLALLAPYIAFAVAVVAVTIGAVYARRRWSGKSVVQKRRNVAKSMNSLIPPFFMFHIIIRIIWLLV